MNGNSSVPERSGAATVHPAALSGGGRERAVARRGRRGDDRPARSRTGYRCSASDAEGAALIVALLLVVAINLYLVRRVVGPRAGADRAGAARRPRATTASECRCRDPTSEAGELALTFNEMLARLEAERREATGRVLAGQESERLRIAQELHDQVGQELTAVLLGLARVAGARAEPSCATTSAEVQERGPREPRGRPPDRDRAAAGGARRPRACQSALAVLCERFGATLRACRSAQQIGRGAARARPRGRARRLPRRPGGADERRAPLRRRRAPT